MKGLHIFALIFLFTTPLFLTAQNVILEGYTFETDNRGYLRNVQLKALHKRTGELVATGKSDREGSFSLSLPRNKEYTIVAEKKMYQPTEAHVTTVGLKENEKSFVKMEMERKPGYFFDVTIAEAATKGQATVNAITGARIEVYNNTTQKEEMVLLDFPHPNFTFGFEKGFHYTIMIRKKGFLTKRIEAYVNVEDCILCFDGLGIVSPEVTEVLSDGLSTGTLLANVEMQPAKINKTFRIENIYYDFDKWDIRPDAAEELDKLITIIKDNPGITMELGSHTDSRGSNAYNMVLSDKRARSAVDYLIASGLIAEDQLKAKGYGESKLVNRCDDGVPCTEEEHQENRRTELKIIGIAEEDPLDKKSLKEILQEEQAMREVMQPPVKIK